MDSEHILHTIKKADLVTLANAVMGFLAILLLMDYNFDGASILILLAAVADGLDGAVSRRYAFGPLGKNLDSLSDAISFGFVPAIASYLVLEPVLGVSAFFFSILFLSCGLLRLARFNISTSNNFQGIPITAAGLIIMLFLMQRETLDLFPYLLVLLLILLSLLMVSRVSYPKIRDPRIAGVIALAMVLTISLFAFKKEAFNIFAEVLLIMMLAYIIAPTLGFPREKNPGEA